MTFISKKIRIKKGDQILVTVGKDKGKHGIVLEVFPKKSSLIVKDINLVKKHVKPNQTNPGGIISKESKIHISNVVFWDQKDNKPTKIGYRFNKDGLKERFSKKTGLTIN